MARRDVDLVIKAKDQAAAVVDSITDALNDFIEAQKNLDTRADKTENSLTALGTAIGKLDKQFRDLGGGDKLSAELDKSSAALARMEARFEATQAEAEQLGSRLKRAGAQSDRFAAKVEGATAAQRKQQAVLKQAKTDQQALTRAYEEAVKAQDKLAGRQEKLPGMIEKAQIAADKAALRFDELSTQMAGTAEPSRTLTNNLDASRRAVDKTQEKLSKLRQEYSEIGGSLNAAGAAVTLFGQQAERAASSVATQERVLQKIGSNLTELKGQSDAAGRAQNKLASDSEKVSASLRQQDAALGRAEESYVELATSAGRADDQIRALGQRGFAALESSLARQRRTVLEAKRAYVEASAEATRLGKAVANAANPSDRLVAAFERARATVKSNKTALLENRVAYEELSRTMLGTTADLDSVEAAQVTFVATQDRLSQSAERAKKELNEEVAAINRLYGVTTSASTSTRNLANSQDRMAGAADRHARSTRTLAGAYREFYGDTRRSLSLMQRIRGEVLSLVAAYGGLYGAIEVLRGTVDATQKLEAAQARLGVAFDGDIAQTSKEMDFLRRTADRLGIDLGTLATEFSKFSIATKNTALEGQATRDIFLSVAEAARVNRSTTQEMSGVFVALTQIVSKGAVQMEELRQQLGDRLPGALKIMADGLGVTTAELVKMMEQGQVTEAALIPFAKELDKRFGPGLSDSLEGVTVALGRLGNAAFQALVQFGQAGFIDSFTDFVNTLTETLGTADFQDFAARVSSALGGVLDLLGFLARNFDLVVAAAAGFLGLKLAPFIILIASKLGILTGSTVSTARGFRALNAALASGQVQMTATQVAATRAGIAIRGLLSATGIGLAVTAVAAGLALWSTAATEATEALVAHKELVDQVKNAYDEAGGSVDEWRSKIEDLTVTRAKENLKDLQDAAESLQSELGRIFLDAGQSTLSRFTTGPLIGGVSSAYQKEVRRAIQLFRDGKVEADEFAKRIDEVNQKYDDGSGSARRFADQLDEQVEKIVANSKAQDEARAILKAKIGTDEEAAEAARELGIALEEAGDGMDPEKTKAYEKATGDLKKIIDDTADSTEYLDTVMKIEGAFEEAIKNAQTLEERIAAAIDRAEALGNATQQFVDAEFGSFTDGTEASAALIRQFEGFRSTPYFDVNAYRAGFGSDTVTLSDGTIKKVTQGMTVSIADANRDLVRRITSEFTPIAARASGDRFQTFTPQQQAALTSIAYNYGEIPDRVANVLKTGTAEQIADAIRSLGGDNGGINQNRRNQEAALFTSSAAQTTAVREAERQLELEKEQKEQTTERLAQNDHELSQQQLLLQGKERQAAIEEAIREAKRENPNITQAEINKIVEQTGKLYDMEQAVKNRKTATEQAQEAEEEVNRLLGIQQELREQLELANTQGDVAKASELREEINKVNEELLKAIDNAQQMWNAVGGGAADAANAKLQTAKVRAEAFGNEATNTYLKWDRVATLFIDGMARAFDTFAQAVAEGTSIGEAARTAFLQFAADFLREIAQMIIKQAILNALRSAFGGTGFGSLIGIPAAHHGGRVGSGRIGSGNIGRKVDPAVFAGAMRYHVGGFAGLQPGDVPAILQQGEEVLTRDDPRHALNAAAQAMGGGKGKGTTIINAVDGSDALEQALSQSRGQDVQLNFIRSRREEIRQLLGI